MTRAIQCNDCGTVLLGEELFCGECGAPRPSVVTPAPAVEQPRVDEPPDSSTIRQSNADTAWRVVAAVLGAGGALLCLFGFALFLLRGLLDGEDLTAVENWLYAAVCCLLPIGGTGAVAAIAGLVIWRTRLRKR